MANNEDVKKHALLLSMFKLGYKAATNEIKLMGENIDDNEMKIAYKVLYDYIISKEIVYIDKIKKDKNFGT